MKIVKKLILLGLLVVLSFVGYKYIKDKNDSKYISKAVYLYNLTDEKEVLSKNENEKLPMASLTKIMTVRVALKNIFDLGNLCPVDMDSYYRAVDMNASMAGFVAGEATSYRDLLYATMLASAGEAADSLAVNISGSMDNFVNLMNREAESLGLDVKKTRLRVILASTMITASSISLCGQIGFIGLIIPHMARMIIGANTRYLIPLSLSLGAGLMVIIEALSRSLSVVELPISIITAIIGAPIIIRLIRSTGGVFR